MSPSSDPFSVGHARAWLAANPVTRIGLICVMVVVGVFVADQASKAWILYGLNLPERFQVRVLPFFNLTLVHNVGISFGLLGSGGVMRWALTLFQIAAGAGLCVMLTRLKTPWLAIALALIAGGAFGNGLDRLRFGYVVDFLDFSKIWPPYFFPWVFNVADAGITIGVAMLFWHFFRAESARVKSDGPNSGAMNE